MKKWINSKGRYVFISLLIVLMMGMNCEMVDFLPLFSYALQEEVQETWSLWDKLMLEQFPIVVHAVEKSNENPWMEDREENGLSHTAEEEQEGFENLLEGMKTENGLLEGMLAENSGFEEIVTSENPPNDLGQETGSAFTGVWGEGFVKHEKIGTVDVEQLLDYQTLISAFYTIDGGTSVGNNQLNAEKFLEKDMSISKETEGPQILIYHTHSLEGFADSVLGDVSQTIIGAGDRLTQILTEQYGYKVLHHTEEYDTDRSDAYANSLPGITKVLEDNPSIQVVIDLHRDAGVKNVRRVIDLDGRQTATFMFFNGLSRTKRTGDIDYLYNPNLEDNLAFSFQMQKAATEYYPGITRKIYLKAYRYNMHLSPRTLLIELGDSNSTVEEIMNACDPLAHILDIVLSGGE